MQGEPRIVGIRHHSPACARLVRRALDTSPCAVLIEGPADFNDRLDELALAHRPPIAIFSHHREGPTSRASWLPYCDYSPEWVALREGLRRGAHVRFIDLPAWAQPGRRRGPRPGTAAVARACARFGVDGYDALWDHLFEGPQELESLATRLEAWFVALRDAEPEPPSDERAREAFMARHVAHAMEEHGEALVIVGGLHAPALARTWRDADPTEPPLPEPTGVAGSYLVPFSFARLDAHGGYGAGLPSPGYYQSLWEHGPRGAGERALEASFERLRQLARPPRTADLIAARATAVALGRLRGRPEPSRVDVLDGIASALVKRALDAPLPWAVSGPVSPDTDPRLLAVLGALRGERRGTLDPRTPRPPLIQSAREALAHHDLTPMPREREETLDLATPAGREASWLLHRLVVLELPGFRRLAGPKRAVDPELVETWALVEDRALEARLAEAASWGATPAEAAAARLAARIENLEGNTAGLVRALTDALLAGLEALGDAAADAIATQVLREPRLDRLGPAMRELIAMHRLAPHAASVEAALRATIPRALWLLEGARGATLHEGEIDAVVALRDATRTEALAVDVAPLTDAMRRIARAPRAPLSLRGAAVGWLWSVGRLEPSAAQTAAAEALDHAPPARAGDLLAGLFALAREPVLRTPALLATLDAHIARWDERTMREALPALRLAFAYFPPRERDRIAQAVLALHGADADTPLRKLPRSAEVIARARALEEDVDAVLAAHGLGGDV